MNFFKRLYLSYVLKRYPIKHQLWASAIGRIPLLRDIGLLENVRLRELATLFIHQKKFSGVGVLVTEEMQVMIAAQACLPVLSLGVEWLQGWVEIIIYPDAFWVNRDEPDEFGIIHQNERLLSGEAWGRGPLILSWNDIQKNLHEYGNGRNVIIHEVAHKLDMLNGRANGMPPLHLSMSAETWSSTFSAAYDHLHSRLNHHHRICVNPYAATSPAEFFAVISEYFFSAPDVLSSCFPRVYQQMKLFYQLDPLKHFASTG